MIILKIIPPFLLFFHERYCTSSGMCVFIYINVIVQYVRYNETLSRSAPLLGYADRHISSKKYSNMHHCSKANIF